MNLIFQWMEEPETESSERYQMWMNIWRKNFHTHDKVQIKCQWKYW